MLIIKPNSMPPLWWLFPWSYARQLYRNGQALKALADKQDDLLKSKVSTRQRWSIWISGLPGPDRKYLFLDGDGKSESPSKSVITGKMLHFHGATWTTMKNAEDAIVFCNYLNHEEPK